MRKRAAFFGASGVWVTAILLVIAIMAYPIFDLDRYNPLSRRDTSATDQVIELPTRAAPTATAQPPTATPAASSQGGVKPPAVMLPQATPAAIEVSDDADGRHDDDDRYDDDLDDAD